jgi:hypothetical protein
LRQLNVQEAAISAALDAERAALAKARAARRLRDTWVASVGEALTAFSVGASDACQERPRTGTVSIVEWTGEPVHATHFFHWDKPHDAGKWQGLWLDKCDNTEVHGVWRITHKHPSYKVEVADDMANHRFRICLPSLGGVRMLRKSFQDRSRIPQSFIRIKNFIDAVREIGAIESRAAQPLDVDAHLVDPILKAKEHNTDTTRNTNANFTKHYCTYSVY